ncbi:endonuclease III [Candidatus Bathyarchaeota archaeon]|nr:MAG: endonuclease III [Candidatus Bathyarchaeota archaeon]
MDEEERVQEIIKLLEAEHPDARIALNFSNPFELLVAVMLSAQTTDERVNQVTKTLFKKSKRPEDYVQVDLEELERDIKPTGYYRNKARILKKCCEVLIEKYNSEVPKSLEDLLKLPGVGRKTANMVLSNAYGIVEGIAVDTHVRRVSRRLGLTENTDPEKIEMDLMAKIPREKWARITDLLIFHGRRVCSARKPKCSTCVLNKLCPSAFKIEHK